MLYTYQYHLSDATGSPPKSTHMKVSVELQIPMTEVINMVNNTLATKLKRFNTAMQRLYLTTILLIMVLVISGSDSVLDS